MILGGTLAITGFDHGQTRPTTKVWFAPEGRRVLVGGIASAAGNNAITVWSVR
jgi:hypothetical protein